MAEFFHHTDPTPSAQTQLDHAEQNRKRYGRPRPHGYYPPDVKNIGGHDYAVFPSGSAYRIRWHERTKPNGDPDFRPQYVSATVEERRMLRSAGLLRVH